MEGTRRGVDAARRVASSEQGTARRLRLDARRRPSDVDTRSRRRRRLAVPIARRRPRGETRTVLGVLLAGDEETSQQRRGLATRGAVRQRTAAIVVHVPEHRRSARRGGGRCRLSRRAAIGRARATTLRPVVSEVQTFRGARAHSWHRSYGVDEGPEPRKPRRAVARPSAEPCASNAPVRFASTSGTTARATDSARPTRYTPAASTRPRPRSP